jgi:TonB family protein
MTTLIQICGLPLVHALGWTLLHLCWQGALVAIVLWCVLGVLSGRSSRARYGAACLALGLMVALPLATFAHLAADEYRMRAEFDSSAVVIDTGMVLQVSAGETTTPWPERISAALDQGLPWVLMAWFAGVVLFVVRLNLGLLVARRMRWVATTAAPTELQQAFDAVRRRLGVERAVRLMHSALVQVPTVIGWLRPVVLVPASCLSGLSAMQIEAILAHELAHIRRHDYLVSVLQSVIETLLFYHPAVWWVSRQVRRERECCCDEMAVAVGGDRLAYARALSVLEERRACTPEFVLGANGGVLTMRIKRLLGCGGASISSQLAAGMVLAILMAVAGSYGLTAARAEVNALSRAARAASPMELEAATPLNTLIALPAVRQLKAMLLQPAAANSGTVVTNRNGTVYTTWLNQDVLWIITPQERAAFLNLTNDEERDKFIEQFWARRDAPGAPANSFRAEHYRRIAYSNEHFASESPGWRSDRGRMYILYGTPDSMDSHPSGATYPYEMWHYRSADGHGIDMMFEDTCQCGKYLLESQNAAGVQGSGGAVTQSNSGPAAGDGTIAGSIVDQNGAAVPGAKVTSTNTENGIQTSSETDSAGKYSVSSLYPGPYNVEVVAKGFQRLLQENVHVESGKTVGLNLKLTVAPVSHTLTAPGAPSSPTAPAVLAAPDGPIRVSADTASGMILSKIDPEYPEIAKAAHVQGTVILHAIISKTGTVERLDVISGNGMLVNAARDAVSRWTYKPYLLNGQPMEVETSITVNFSLADSVAQGTTNQTVFTLVEQRYKELLALEGTAQGAANRAQLTLAEQEYREFLALEPKQIGGDVTGPIPIYEPEPVYSAEAKKAKFMGIVTVGIIVDKNGMPQNVHVTRGVGMGLDEKAVEAVKQYKFKPAMENGKPVAVYMNIEVNFEIF